jgi:2-oxoglutarate ferredoxin oxidoreductase subunit beta
VARTTAAHPREIDKLITQGIKHKGMAVIEVLDDCPTTYGRRNKFRSVVDMMKQLKANAVPAKAAAKMTAEQLQGKFLTGILFQDTEKPEYCDMYQEVINKAQGV